MSDKTLQMLLSLLETIFKKAWKRWEQKQREKIIKKAIEEGDEIIDQAFENMDSTQIDSAFQSPDSRMLKSDDKD